MITNLCWSLCKVPGYSRQILTKRELFRHIFEKYSSIKFHENHLPVGAELFRADGQTYMTRLVVAFRNCAKAPKKDKAFPAMRTCRRSRVLYPFLIAALDGGEW